MPWLGRNDITNKDRTLKNKNEGHNQRNTKENYKSLAMLLGMGVPGCVGLRNKNKPIVVCIAIVLLYAFCFCSQQPHPFVS